MIKSVNNYPISQLFDIDASVIYAVPRYQREYTWTKVQWENLFDDLVENEAGYFLGSIICINQSTDALITQRLEVVDGQQRLTTLSLLFAAVYNTLANHENLLDEEQLNEKINLKRKLVLRRGQDQIRVIPQTQNSNQNDYRAVLAEIKVVNSTDVPKNAGNRKVFRAFRYFESRIASLEKVEANRLSAVMMLLDKINQASLVKIEVASHADAYILFESLNNRGMPLTPIDLIKNKLLARLESIEPGQIDNYFDKWNRLLGYLGDDYNIQERFLRHYYNAFKEDLKAIHQVPVATRSNIIQIYEKLIENDAKEFLEAISAASRQYALFVSRNQDDASNALEKPFKDLERIQGAPSYLLMLNLMMRKDELAMREDGVSKIIDLLVRFFVRRNLTDTPPTRDLTRLFMSSIELTSKISGTAIVAAIHKQLMSVSASDDIFRSKLEGSIYEENANVTRFVLCALAERSMTKETFVDLWRVEGKQFVWTIEHIFPQGENIPSSWVEMIADGDDQKAKTIQQNNVHKLGNLTISGFNSALGNKSFIEKRDRVDKQERPVGYKNGLRLNDDLAIAGGWSVDQINARTVKLVEQALAAFRMD